MREPKTVTAQLTLTLDQLAAALAAAGVKDRRADMAERYGEACTRGTAAKILSCSVSTVRAMLADGRIQAACGGTRVDVRSIADYIERKNEDGGNAKAHRKRAKNPVEYYK